MVGQPSVVKEVAYPAAQPTGAGQEQADAAVDVQQSLQLSPPAQLERPRACRRSDLPVLSG